MVVFVGFFGISDYNTNRHAHHAHSMHRQYGRAQCAFVHRRVVVCACVCIYKRDIIYIYINHIRPYMHICTCTPSRIRRVHGADNCAHPSFLPRYVCGQVPAFRENTKCLKSFHLQL